jgi:hypothetical protein
VKGIKFAELFEKKAARFDITKERVILERVGSGKNTQYTIDRTNDTKVPKFDESTIPDLEEVFGLDDERYEDMERIAKTMGSGSGGGGNGGRGRSRREERDEESTYSGPKRGTRHRSEEAEEEEAPPARNAGGRNRARVPL